MDIEEIKYVTFTSPEEFRRMDEIFRADTSPVDVSLPKIESDPYREMRWNSGPKTKGYYEPSNDDSLVVAKIVEFRELYDSLPKSVAGIYFEGDFERGAFCREIANYLASNEIYFMMMADSGYIAQEEIMRFSKDGRKNNSGSQLPQVLLE